MGVGRIAVLGVGLFILVCVSSHVPAAELGNEKQASIGVVYVDQATGVDSESQSGEESEAYASITFALQQLATLQTPQPWTVNVKAGTYSATAENPESFPLTLHTGMVLQGVDGADNVIISGLDNPDGTVSLVYGDGATGVRISGITFRDQNKTAGSLQGGAMELLEFGGTVTNCKFTNNKSTLRGGALFIVIKEGEHCDLNNILFDTNQAASTRRDRHEGGAVCIDGDFAGALTDCTFANNSVTKQRNDAFAGAYGAAMFVRGNMATSSFERNRFESNKANAAFSDLSYGGGLCVLGDLTATVNSSEFIDNDADSANGYGGGLYVGGIFTGALEQTNFSDNFAGYQGGGLYAGTSGGISMQGCTFDSNRVASDQALAHQGGGVFVGSSLTGAIDDCIFTNNTADKIRNDAPAGAFGAGMFINGDLTATSFERNRFEDNTAHAAFSDVSYGAGLCILGDFDATIDSCHFINNEADDENGYGGGLYVQGELTGSIDTSTFVENFAGYQGGGVYVAGGAFSIVGARFEDNRVQSGEAIQHRGGGICIASDFGGSIADSDFLRNTVTGPFVDAGACGGGISIDGNFTPTEFARNRFVGNEVLASRFSPIGSFGGGLCVLGNLEGVIDSSQFANNACDDVRGHGGAVYVGGFYSGGLSNSRFQDNSAASAGGSVFCAGSWTGDIESSDFIRNSVKTRTSMEFDFAVGGAVAVGGAFDGDISGSLFSDNYFELDGAADQFGAGLAFLAGFDGLIENSVFTNNRTTVQYDSYGGAILFRGKVGRDSVMRGNTFSRNYSEFGGALYFGFEGDLPPDIYNNFFLYSETAAGGTTGASILTSQNVNVFNNTFWGGIPETSAILLQDTADGSLIKNNIFSKVAGAVKIVGENSVRITHNDFFETVHILDVDNVGLGNMLSEISSTVGNSTFESNTTLDPMIFGEGDSVQNLVRFSGRLDLNAFYDPENRWTVFTEVQGVWNVDELAGLFLNLSQNQDLRDQYPIVGNSQTEIYISGDLFPEYEGLNTGDNRGGLGDDFTVDNYRLMPQSPLLDAGDTVITDRNEDITPLVDFEGDIRPLNCALDIGADEGARPTPSSISLVGLATPACIPIGGQYTEMGATALDTNGESISEQIVISGSVDTSTEGSYMVTYTVDNCMDTPMQVVRTVLVGCGEPPEANAGPDQTVQTSGSEPVTVQLDGSGSSDSDGTITSYIWIELGGDNDPDDEVSPTISLSAGEYTFELMVTDNLGNLSRDEVNVTVEEGTGALPVARAGQDQSVTVGAGGTIQVTLDGSTSTDADGTIVSYAWLGLNGAPDPDDVVSPVVTLSAGTYEFRLSVSDNDGNNASDTVTVAVVEQVAGAPTAIATSEVLRSIDPGNRLPRILLRASESTDTDGTIVSFVWMGLDGAPDPEDTETSAISLEPGEFLFQLVVTDNDGLTDTTTVQVNVARPPLSDIREVIREDFATADGNRDGQMSASEARAYIPYLLDSEFESLDTDGSGGVTEAEVSPSDPPMTMGCSGATSDGDALGVFSLFGDVAIILVLAAFLSGYGRRRIVFGGVQGGST